MSDVNCVTFWAATPQLYTGMIIYSFYFEANHLKHTEIPEVPHSHIGNHGVQKSFPLNQDFQSNSTHVLSVRWAWELYDIKMYHWCPAARVGLWAQIHHIINLIADSLQQDTFPLPAVTFKIQILQENVLCNSTKHIEKQTQQLCSDVL